MNISLAPMEGITGHVYRRAHHQAFGHCDRYYTPFLTNLGLSRKEEVEILPENNAGMDVIPQVLTNRADVFLNLARVFQESGYREVNLNIGCPSGTVVARNRGAGFLSVPEELESFLDEIFEKCPLKISVKTRIGINDLSEWKRLLSIYAKYPMEELIIHPRLQKEGYGGTTHTEAFAEAAGLLPIPLCYNGDIVSSASLNKVLTVLPGTEAVMIGRGIVQNPGLLIELQPSNGKPSCSPGSTDRLATLRAFHDEILEGYIKIMSGDTNTLYKMKDLWTFLSQGFENSEKYLKKIRKASRITDYRIAVDALFRECKFAPPGAENK